MMRSLTALGAMLGVLLATPLASAQGKGSFGQQGDFILSADRLLPLFSFTSVSQVAPGAPGPGVSKVTNTDAQTALSFFQGGTPPLQTFFTFPRVGLDYVLIPNVTIGGDLLFYTTLGGHHTTETDLTNGSSTTDTTASGSMLTFGIAPRGGYILPLSELFSLWLRGGLFFYTSSVKTPEGAAGTMTESTNQFGIDLDPQLVFTPIPHFGITGGLTADIPIAGGHSITHETPNASTTDSAGSSIFFFGVTAGLIGWF
jgi:hypothetical protein